MFSNGFPQDKQITYSGMLWLLATQLVVMAPLIFYLPIWLLPLLFFSAGWRIRMMKNHLEQPSLLIKILIAALGIAALSMGDMKLASLDMMASLLMLGFAYKALEIHQRRDAMVILLTGFLLIAVSFLYSQTILTTLYGIFSLTILSGAMIAIQQSKSYAIIPTLRFSALMLLLCLPLMLLFFVFSPRLAPLWKIPLQAGHGKTGISDSMAPGDIANLSKSDELAFTVKFSGELPKQKQLYWRGLVLQHFDGKTWRPFEKPLSFAQTRQKLQLNRPQLRKKLIKKGYGKKYEVIYEKTARPWLFTLSPVVDFRGDAFYSSDFRLLSNSDILEPKMLTIVSYPETLREVKLPESTRRQTLQLPKNSNPKSVALVAKLLKQSTSKQDYINKVLNHYTQQAFYYTLRPPVLGSSNTIDKFLFESKKGFCAHYAGSFVFMMRAANIPARVVTGYQGGAWNKAGKFLTVRQYDAHAWTEVWLENQGWLRFDPTASVAPDRIEKNLEAAVDEEGSFLEGNLFTISKYKWLSDLKSKLDYSQYAWRRFVLGYDDSTKKDFLEKIFGELTIQKTATIVGGIFFIIILFWAAFLGLAKKTAKEATEHQLYRRFCALLSKKGINRKLSQTPESFSRYATIKLPRQSAIIQKFSNVYSEICYNPEEKSNSVTNIKTLKSLLKQLKRSLKR